MVARERNLPWVKAQTLRHKDSRPASRSRKHRLSDCDRSEKWRWTGRVCGYSRVGVFRLPSGWARAAGDVGPSEATMARHFPPKQVVEEGSSHDESTVLPFHGLDQVGGLFERKSWHDLYSGSSHCIILPHQIRPKWLTRSQKRYNKTRRLQ